jgi:hypothetical protein
LNSAVVEYKKAIGEEPDSGVALARLARVYLATEKAVSAEELLKRAMEKNPAYSTPFVLMGTIYFDDGRYKEAQQVLLQASVPTQNPRDLGLDRRGRGQFRFGHPVPRAGPPLRPHERQYSPIPRPYAQTPMTNAKVPEPWRQRLSILGQIAGELRLPAAAVGGCVRDLLLGKTPKDWDVVVEGQAVPLVRSAAKKMAARVVEHPRFLTFTLHFPDGTHLDISTARSETYPTPGILPVVRPATLVEDAQRRDFTSNALYLQLNPTPGTLLDPTGGQADMGAGQLRVLHDQSFVDDPTRLYRAARYATRYGWAVEGKTLELIHKAVLEDRPKSVSLVRLRHELFRILEEENPIPALRTAWDWGLWKYWDESWRYTDTLATQLKSVPRESPPGRRLAIFLGPDPAIVEAALKRFSTPTDLRKSVLRYFSSHE